MITNDKIVDGVLQGRLELNKGLYGRPTEGSTTYRPTAGLPGQSDKDGDYVRKLLNMDPEEFWLRQGWMKDPLGQWYKDTGMGAHIAAVENQEKLAKQHGSSNGF